MRQPSQYLMCILVTIIMHNLWSCSDDYDALDVEQVSEGLYSTLGGVEWQIDAPWRMEPTITGGVRSYDKVPIALTFQDTNMLDDWMDPAGNKDCTLKRFCGVHVVEFSPDVSPANYGKPVDWDNAKISFVDPESFHEFESEGTWPDYFTDTPTPATQNYVVRLWDGEPLPEYALDICQSASWNASFLYEPQRGAPVGKDLRLLVIAAVSTDGDCDTIERPPIYWKTNIPNKMSRSRVTTDCHGESAEDRNINCFNELLKVHYPDSPLPTFGGQWVYGDLHYHAQGTDNEGEGALPYRVALQGMKAMGLDYAFAAEHASDSLQLTSAQALLVDNIPEIPNWVPLVEDWILDNIPDLIEFPNKHALRDMNDDRYRYLLDTINNEDDGVNQQVFSSGLGRAPQIFLGGEVDVIPEISRKDMNRGWLNFGYSGSYNWKEFCKMPEAIVDELEDRTNWECDPYEDLLVHIPEEDVFLLRDVQGLIQYFFARQHMLHLPSDPANEDTFVRSETTDYGGARRRLKDVLQEDYVEENKGSIFIAHPVEGTTGSGIGRLGPDMVPWSEVQLEKAFKSPHVLGLQAWNSDPRFSSSWDKEVYPFHPMQPRLPEGFVPDGFPFDYGYDRLSYTDATLLQDFTTFHLAPSFKWEEQSSYEVLHMLKHSTAMWDRMLLWGITPSKTEKLTWLGYTKGAIRKVFMAGGSDAHGDLNYHRMGRFFGWMGANDNALGKVRNLTHVGWERPKEVDSGQGRQGNTISQEQVMDALKSGNFAVTDGPALRIAIDRNGDNRINSGDIPMGQIGSYSGTTSIPLLVEWKSTTEFGPVKAIHLYVGVQSGEYEGLVYAPEYHGTMGGGSESSATVCTDDKGRDYKRLTSSYILDPTGKLSITVAPSQGMGGTATVLIKPNDYRLYTAETSVVNKGGGNNLRRKPLDDIMGGMTGPGEFSPWDPYPDPDPDPGPSIETECAAVDILDPSRLYMRAFALTSDVETGVLGATQTQTSVSRLAYTNPIWVNVTKGLSQLRPTMATMKLAQ